MHVASLSSPSESSMSLFDNNLNEVDKFKFKRAERIRASREEAARMKRKEESEYKARRDADKIKQITAALKASADKEKDRNNVSGIRQNGLSREVPSQLLTEKKATEVAVIVGEEGKDLHRKEGALAMDEKVVVTKNRIEQVESLQTKASDYLPKEGFGVVKTEEEKRNRGRQEFLRRRDDGGDETSVAPSVSSRAIRKLRKKQEMKELGLRQQLQSMSAKSEDSESSRSFETMDSSLRSFKSLQTSRSGSKGSASIQWENQYVQFSFGLLTAHEETPQPGQYNSDRSSRNTSESLKNLPNSSILEVIMSKAMSLSKAIIEQRSGNVIMKCQKPFITSVETDGK